MSEAQIMRDIWDALSRGSRRIFRNNVGMGWSGGTKNRKPLKVTPMNLSDARAAIRPGDVIVPSARPLHAGLETGSADHIGWQTAEISITPSMVGTTLRLAIFLSLESKAASGRTKASQLNWQEQVRRAGGIGVIARSVEGARAEIESQLAALLHNVTGET